jgi:predicted nucleotidyltransferase component of viral defense system
LKGGNALDFIWHPNRSTLDLDFSAESSIRPEDRPETWLARTLQQALDASTPSLGTLYRIQRFRRQPPGDAKTFVSLNGNIAYALQDEARLQTRIRAGEPLARIIPIEISLNEVLCDVADIRIDDRNILRICTIEDIVAEKLRALLQQVIRNRIRSQDLLDIVVLLRNHPIRAHIVSGYLLRKAEARHVPVSRTAFRNPEVASRARQDYAALQATVRYSFIAFDDALHDLLSFVDTLDIPE